MKPSTLIIMSVGLFFTLVGFILCISAQVSASKNYPDVDFYGQEGDSYEVIDGDVVRKTDFSDKIYVNDKEVSLDVKVLSVSLSDIDEVEIIGKQNVSSVEVYNMTPGKYACKISSGIITLSNNFDETMIFDYLSDALKNFNGLRSYLNPSSLKGKTQKVVININDNDILNRIDLNLTNCKNVTVKNLTCSLDCKVVLDNSSIVFESCSFKDPDVIYPDAVVPGTSATSPSPSPASPDSESGSDTTGGDETPEIINYHLTMDLVMKNGSTFETKTCKFSEINAVVNKKTITGKDVEENPDKYSTEDIGKYISNGGKPCTLKLDLSAAGFLYGFDIQNTADAEYLSDSRLQTQLNGTIKPSPFRENADNEDFPPVKINASNTEILILS